MRLHVLNPVACKREKRGSSAPRLASFEGTRIGLVWNHRAGGDHALKRVDELLKQRYPRIQTKNYSGAVGGSIRYMTTDVLQKIARECSAVVASTGD